MNPRPKGKEETAYNRFCHDIEKAFIEAVGSGARLDDLLYYAHGFVIRRMDPPILAMAIKESAVELRLKKASQNEERPSQDGLQADHTPSQENSGKNQDCSSGPAKAPNNSPEGNLPCLGSCCMMAAAVILEALFAISDPATEGCAAARPLPEYARQTAAPFCTQSDTREPRPVAVCQGSCRECLQTIRSFPKYMNFQFPCLVLQSILDQAWGEKQGGAA